MLVKRKENKSCSMNFAEVHLIIFEHFERKEHSERGLKYTGVTEKWLKISFVFPFEKLMSNIVWVRHPERAVSGQVESVSGKICRRESKQKAKTSSNWKPYLFL